VDNIQIASTLETIGHLLDILGENSFKVRAYENAARAIEGLEVGAAAMAREGKLKGIPGVGDGIAKKVDELVQTGRMTYLEELKSKIPIGLLDILRIPSVGPKKVRALWQELGVTSLATLEKACTDHRVRMLKGFGEKTEYKILEGIKFVAVNAGRFRLDQVIPVARTLLTYVRSAPMVARTEVCGSIRRWKETIRDADILASSDAPEQVIAHFLKADGIKTVLGQGPTKCSVVLNSGLQVDLRVVKDDEFAPALAYFTGSKEHNVLLRARAQRIGLSVNEYGVLAGDIRQKVASEEELYAMLGLAFVPPELREGRDEIDLAEKGALPTLVRREDVIGVLHVHSNWSDGTADIGEMAEKARKQGLKYMGLSDHSKAGQAYNNGMTEKRLAQQMEEVARLNQGWTDFRILMGLECDILPDGTLDMDAELLSKLDFLIGSIHSRFDMPEPEMTDRICKALGNNNLDMLGHPTGRHLLSRDAYKVDLERVIQTAARHRKMIELNANPSRLDLDAAHVRRARELGVMVSINPDAHSVQGMDDLEYGVATARRAGCSAKDVLNSRPMDEALKLLNRG